MSRPDQDRFAEIERCYRDAVNNYYADMAAAKSEAEALAVEQNYYDAERTYNSALAKMLAGTSAEIDATLASLKRANDRVEKLRDDGKALADILKAAGQAISLATKLFLIAG